MSKAQCGSCEGHSWPPDLSSPSSRSRLHCSPNLFTDDIVTSPPTEFLLRIFTGNNSQKMQQLWSISIASSLVVNKKARIPQVNSGEATLRSSGRPSGSVGERPANRKVLLLQSPRVQQITVKRVDSEKEFRDWEDDGPAGGPLPHRVDPRWGGALPNEEKAGAQTDPTAGRAAWHWEEVRGRPRNGESGDDQDVCGFAQFVSIHRMLPTLPDLIPGGQRSIFSGSQGGNWCRCKDIFRPIPAAWVRSRL